MKHKNNVQIEHLKGLEALRFWELKTVVGKFNALGIPVMLVKGAVDLADPQNHPPGLPPRAMADLDLLVHEKDWEKAVEGLCDLGYEPLFKDEKDSLRFDVPGQKTYIRSDPPGRIDLHHDLNKYPQIRRYIDSEELWRRGRQVEFHGNYAIVPSITDRIWYQLVHLFFFHTDSLEMLAGKYGSIWYLIAMADFHRDNINWDEFNARAKQFKAELPLHLLAFGMKAKYKMISGIEVEESIIRYASHVWRWMMHALHLPGILTYSLGRFTVLSLIRRYGFFKICKVYFSDTVRGTPDEDLLAKYRVSRLHFLYPAVYLIHFLRLVILHVISGIFYTGFIMKEGRNKLLISD